MRIRPHWGPKDLTPHGVACFEQVAEKSWTREPENPLASCRHDDDWRHRPPCFRCHARPGSVAGAQRSVAAFCLSAATYKPEDVETLRSIRRPSTINAHCKTLCDIVSGLGRARVAARIVRKPKSQHVRRPRRRPGGERRERRAALAAQSHHFLVQLLLLTSQPSYFSQQEVQQHNP